MEESIRGSNQMELEKERAPILKVRAPESGQESKKNIICIPDKTHSPDHFSSSDDEERDEGFSSEDRSPRVHGTQGITFQLKMMPMDHGDDKKIVLDKGFLDLLPNCKPLAKPGYSLQPDIKFGWKPTLVLHGAPIPLRFDYEDNKFLSALGSREKDIIFNGFRPPDSLEMHKKYVKLNAENSYPFKFPDPNSILAELQRQSAAKEKLNDRKAGMMSDYPATEINFNSYFESGNLDMVVKNTDTDFDLYMRVDTNTRGHHQWFYFRVENGERVGHAKFNIVNFTKRDALYSQGMRIAIGKSEGSVRKWNRGGENITYKLSKLTSQMMALGYISKTYYCLTFEYNFETPNETVYFAYSEPYTFTDLCNFLSVIKSEQEALPADSQFCQESTLCKSLSGLDVPILTVTNKVLTLEFDKTEITSTISDEEIGITPMTSSPGGITENIRKHEISINNQLNISGENTNNNNSPNTENNTSSSSHIDNLHQSKSQFYNTNDNKKSTFSPEYSSKIHANMQKKYVIVTGRVHPGECCGSWMMQGLIRFITGNSRPAIALRNKLIFKIIPMSNPDGVIIGNYRSSMSGNDLNRKFKYPDFRLHPTVCAIKKLVGDIKESSLTETKRNILLFIDLHAHSKKKCVFIYGPYFPLHSPYYVKMRVFPKLLSTLTQMFRYYACKFRSEKSKQKAARLVLSQEFDIMNCFTLEASFHGFINQDRMTIELYPNYYIRMGEHVCNALMDYEYLMRQEEKQARIRAKIRRLAKVKMHDQLRIEQERLEALKIKTREGRSQSYSPRKRLKTPAKFGNSQNRNNPNEAQDESDLISNISDGEADDLVGDLMGREFMDAPAHPQSLNDIYESIEKDMEQNRVDEEFDSGGSDSDAEMDELEGEEKEALQSQIIGVIETIYQMKKSKSQSGGTKKKNKKRIKGIKGKGYIEKEELKVKEFPKLVDYCKIGSESDKSPDGSPLTKNKGYQSPKSFSKAKSDGKGGNIGRMGGTEEDYASEQEKVLGGLLLEDLSHISSTSQGSVFPPKAQKGIPQNTNVDKMLQTFKNSPLIINKLSNTHKELQKLLAHRIKDPLPLGIPNRPISIQAIHSLNSAIFNINRLNSLGCVTGVNYAKIIQQQTSTQGQNPPGSHSAIYPQRGPSNSTTTTQDMLNFTNLRDVQSLGPTHFEMLDNSQDLAYSSKSVSGNALGDNTNSQLEMNDLHFDARPDIKIRLRGGKMSGGAGAGGCLDSLDLYSGGGDKITGGNLGTRMTEEGTGAHKSISPNKQRKNVAYCPQNVNAFSNPNPSDGVRNTKYNQLPNQLPKSQEDKFQGVPGPGLTQVAPLVNPLETPILAQMIAHQQAALVNNMSNNTGGLGQMLPTPPQLLRGVPGMQGIQGSNQTEGTRNSLKGIVSISSYKHAHGVEATSGASGTTGASGTSGVSGTSVGSGTSGTTTFTSPNVPSSSPPVGLKRSQGYKQGSSSQQHGNNCNCFTERRIKEEEYVDLRPTGSVERAKYGIANKTGISNAHKIYSSGKGKTVRKGKYIGINEFITINGKVQNIAPRIITQSNIPLIPTQGTPFLSNPQSNTTTISSTGGQYITNPHMLQVIGTHNTSTGGHPHLHNHINSQECTQKMMCGQYLGDRPPTAGPTLSNTGISTSSMSDVRSQYSISKGFLPTHGKQLKSHSSSNSPNKRAQSSSQVHRGSGIHIGTGTKFVPLYIQDASPTQKEWAKTEYSEKLNIWDNLQESGSSKLLVDRDKPGTTTTTLITNVTQKSTIPHTQTYFTTSLQGALPHTNTYNNPNANTPSILNLGGGILKNPHSAAKYKIKRRGDIYTRSYKISGNHSGGVGSSINTNANTNANTNVNTNGRKFSSAEYRGIKYNNAAAYGGPNWK